MPGPRIIRSTRSSRVAAAMLLVIAFGTAHGQDSSSPGSRPSKAGQKPKAERKLRASVSEIAVSRSGLAIAAIDGDGELSLLSAETTDRRSVLVEPRRLWNLRFSDDGHALVAMTFDAVDGRQTIHVIDPEKGKELRSIEFSNVGEPGFLQSFEFERRTTRLVLQRSKRVETWDVTTGALISAKSGEYEHTEHDGSSRMFCRSERGEVSLYAADAKEPTWRVNVNSDHKFKNPWVTLGGFTNDASVFFVIVVESGLETLADRRVVALSTRNGSVEWTRVVSRSVTGLQDLVPGAETVALIDDYKLCLLDVHTGNVVLEDPTTKQYTCCAACADGKSYWVGAMDGSIVRIEPKPATAKK